MLWHPLLAMMTYYLQSNLSHCNAMRPFPQLGTGGAEEGHYFT